MLVPWGSGVARIVLTESAHNRGMKRNRTKEAMLAYASSVQELAKLTVMMEEVADSFAEMRETYEQIGQVKIGK